MLIKYSGLYLCWIWKQWYSLEQHGTSVCLYIKTRLWVWSSTADVSPTVI